MFGERSIRAVLADLHQHEEWTDQLTSVMAYHFCQVSPEDTVVQLTVKRGKQRRQAITKDTDTQQNTCSSNVYYSVRPNDTGTNSYLVRKSDSTYLKL